MPRLLSKRIVFDVKKVLMLYSENIQYAIIIAIIILGHLVVDRFVIIIIAIIIMGLLLIGLWISTWGCC